MTPIALGLFCAAYILGLLLSALPGQIAHLPTGAIAALGLGAAGAALMPRVWRTGMRSRTWLAAGIIGGIAVLYFQMRVPQPGAQDVSRLLAANFSSVQVQGAIDSMPRLTRSQRIQFWLRSDRVLTSDRTEAVTGRLYVTVPLLQGTGLYPGQNVAVTGFLYDPQPAANPGGFNFQAYLKQEGGFAGLSGRSIAIQPSPPPPLLWLVRQRILRSQVQSLGVPAGVLVSAMVMGRNGVDLPAALQDQFNHVGLAHALAASGFQVALLIRVVLTLTQRLPNSAIWSLGTGIVLAYIGLTGIQPAVLRAGIMGLAALLALTSDRKIRPLASLLVAATALLLWNPLWIWNLGFQFSVLATLGLLVTAQPLANRLDWLPTNLAAIAAVPIAAYLWTLPLQLYAFGIVSPYSIAINILTTPLIVVLSIGGMISALAALIALPLGSLSATLLHFPAQILLQLVAWGDRLPGNTYALGTAAAAQVLLLYGLWAWLSWYYAQRDRHPRDRAVRLWATAAVSISLIVLPAWYTHSHLTQISVLATEEMPVFVVQTPGQVVLINSGSETDVQYTVQPFLRQAGINRIDRAIALDSRSAWQRLRETQAIDQLDSIKTAADSNSAPLRENQTLSLGKLTVRLIRPAPFALEMQLGDRRWLLLDRATEWRSQLALLPRAAVLWWTGEDLPEVFDRVQPEVAIAPQIDEKAEDRLRQRGVKTFETEASGAIAWQPHRITTTLTAE